MITIEKQIDFPASYPLERLGDIEGLLFFDIETTGFSGERSNLYLIGCVYLRDGIWRLTQWFVETPEAEGEVLGAFFTFLGGFTTVVHFNGDMFDIPYLLKRCRALGLPYDFSGIQSIDIYKRIRPYRNLLGLDSMKQKALEQFLGVEREDVFSGGELIEVYLGYLQTGSQRLLDLLLLHNEDDLKGMPRILPILSYPDFFEHGFVLAAQSVERRPDLTGSPRPFLRVLAESEYAVPIAVCAAHPPVSLEAGEHLLTAEIELYEGSLKHYYGNYRDYYYLPYEDSAVHKSVAEYVDKTARVKATAKTCYTKSEGLFLPQLTPLWEPCLQAEYKDKTTYVPYDAELLSAPGRLGVYLSHLFKALCGK